MNILADLIALGIFAAKAIIVALVIIFILFMFFMLLAKGKEKAKAHLSIKNLNDKYEEVVEEISHATCNKKQLKKFYKEKKAAKKAAENLPCSNVFVIDFVGDMKASTVTNLTEEVNAVISAATSADEVLVKIDSGGGLVHTYGLAAAQLMRIRAKNIPLTVAIDKVAASGGYLMACVANKILAAPFAIIGSIGVIVQLPNFHRVLKEKKIDFEMHTAGDFKRTITVFGENTPEGREKLQEEIEDIHGLFKNQIQLHRPQVDIAKVATGEHWMGQQALGLKLVDEIKTADEYLLEKSKTAKIIEISYHIRKPMLSKLTSAAGMLFDKLRLMIM